MTDRSRETVAGRRLGRRDLLRFAAVGAAGAATASLLVACGGNAAPTATGSVSGASGGVAPTATGVARGTTGGTGSTAVTPSGSPVPVGGSPVSVSGAGTPSGSPVPPGGTGGLQVKSDVEIEYWQYQFDSKVELVNQLIPEFQAQNPKIKAKHVNFPYDDFRQKVAAAVQANEGPDVLNVFYGWLPVYVQLKLLVPLPEDAFPAKTIEAAFFPMVKTAQFTGKYYALPTAVRTLALFYNKDLLGAAGKQPPKTWQEFVDVALATTKRSGDKLEVAGATYDPGGQGHQWWRECLNRQSGLVPMSDDKKKLRWSEPAGVEAFTWYMDLVKKHKVGEPAFYTDGETAFTTAHAALHIDGSFRIGSLAKKAPNLDYGIAPLPANKDKASFASYWCNGITRRATGDKLIAAAKFVDFLASPDVMRRWAPKVGELPARPEIAKEDAFVKDEKLSAFIEQLPYAYATFFVNEADDRKAVMDAMDQVLLQNVEPKQAVQDAQSKVQQMLDDYWASVS